MTPTDPAQEAQWECDACPLGRAANALGQKECQECVKGKFAKTGQVVLTPSNPARPEKR